jgi:hypothetical protein
MAGANFESSLIYILWGARGRGGAGAGARGGAKWTVAIYQGQACLAVFRSGKSMDPNVGGYIAQPSRDEARPSP